VASKGLINKDVQEFYEPFVISDVYLAKAARRVTANF
jgi:hypothetical protein